MNITKEFIFSIPKTDLHCHLDGSLRIATLLELAKEKKIPLPSFDPNELINQFGYQKIRLNLNNYLEGFSPLIAILQEQESIERVTYELCEDAFLENIWHLEIRYCPYLLTKKHLTMEKVVESVAKGIEKAKKQYAVSVGQILCGLKHDSMDKIMSVAHLACNLKNQGIVGFDLAGPEVGYKLENYTEVTDFVAENLQNITIHAGENTPSSYIHDAITKTKAKRIGHGTSLIENQELLDYVVNNRITIESCPTSNIHTGSVKSINNHPFKKLLDSNVNVCINTDNRLVSFTDITSELFIVTETFNLSFEQLKKTITNGFKSAFIEYVQKEEMLKKFKEHFEQAQKKLEGLK